jgi:Skp family chaperone for outer membrane proteins
MLNGRFAAFLAAMLIVAAPGFAQNKDAAQPRMATINLTKIFDGYYKRDQAQKVIDQQKDSYDKEYKGMVEEAKKSLEDYQKLKADTEDPLIAATEKEARLKKVQQKYDDVRSHEESLKQFQARANEQVKLSTERMMDRLLTEIRDVVKTVAKKSGYALVLDASAENVRSVTPIVIYTNGENDITDEVLKLLNAAAPASAEPAASPKTAEKAADAKGK